MLSNSPRSYRSFVTEEVYEYIQQYHQELLDIYNREILDYIQDNDIPFDEKDDMKLNCLTRTLFSCLY